MRLLVRPTDRTIRQVAATITSTACDESRICNAKAIFEFVRDNIKYGRPEASDAEVVQAAMNHHAAASCYESDNIITGKLLKVINS